MEPAATPEEVRRSLADLSASTWTLAAVGAAIEVGLPAALLEVSDVASLAGRVGVSEPLVRSLAEALVAAGMAVRTRDGFASAPGLGPLSTGLQAAALRADVRSGLLQATGLFDAATRGSLGTGWSWSDERVLQAQGDTSAAAVELLETRLFPRMNGVLERLDSGEGAFLDVGTGVAAVTIELCRRHPTLRAVGLEPLDAARVLAQRNVRAAGMADRVEIRDQLVQELTETDSFDLAWLPGNFLGPDLLPVALSSVYRALRPGGWVLNASLGGGGDDPASVTARLRAVLWGGDTTTPEQVRDLLDAVGFTEITLFPRLSSGLVPMCARRAS
ncbi:MAG: class I SAM-dependent methyltransferase [Chloroflexota bacterium]|nr:class I SAM-dependent methyltransferase [Chloroflexota bacterium]